MRHAKSSWAVPGAKDFDRELNDRGRSDLEKVSQALATNNYLPELVLCSPAERTRQTVDGIAGVLSPETRVEFHENLYSGGLEDYLSTIRAVSGSKSIMTVGHNPMSGSLSNLLTGDGDPDMIALIAYKYPTATVAVFDFDCTSWSEIGKHKGNLVDCIIPSRL